MWANRSWVEDAEDFIICYADNLTDLDLEAMVRAHKEFRARGAILTMGLFHAPDPKACGIAVLDEVGKIVEFVEKPENPRSDLANAGVYVATKELFDYFPPVQKEYGPVPVKTAATTLLSKEAFSKPAITPFTISVV